jgi:hypothetical protein
MILTPSIVCTQGFMQLQVKAWVLSLTFDTEKNVHLFTLLGKENFEKNIAVSKLKSKIINRFDPDTRTGNPVPATIITLYDENTKSSY